MEKLSITAQKRLLAKTQLGDNNIVKVFIFTTGSHNINRMTASCFTYNMESPDTCLL